LVVAVVQW